MFTALLQISACMLNSIVGAILIQIQPSSQHKNNNDSTKFSLSFYSIVPLSTLMNITTPQPIGGNSSHMICVDGVVTSGCAAMYSPMEEDKNVSVSLKYLLQSGAITTKNT